MAPLVIYKRIPPDDYDLIQRLLKFVNLGQIEWQNQVYKLFQDHPYVMKVSLEDGKTVSCLMLPHWQIRPEDGVQPFVNDQAEIRRVLTLVISRKRSDLTDATRLISDKLGEKIKGNYRPGMVRTTARRADMTVLFQPVLDGVEACLWYPLFLIFQHGIDKLIRRCGVTLRSGIFCGKFFLYTPTFRKYCNTRHTELGYKQLRRRTFEQWINKQRDALGRKPIKWGSRSRSK